MNVTGRDVLLANVTERAWRQQVLDWAKRGGWKRYFTFDSRHSIAGFPDLVLCKPPHIIFAELKTTAGKVAALQQEWIDALRACEGAFLHVVIWRPTDEATVRAALLEGVL